MMGFGFFKNKIIFFLAIFVDENGNRRTWSSGPWTNLRRDYDKEASALVKLKSKRTSFDALHRFIQL